MNNLCFHILSLGKRTMHHGIWKWYQLPLLREETLISSDWNFFFFQVPLTLIFQIWPLDNRNQCKKFPCIVAANKIFLKHYKICFSSGFQQCAAGLFTELMDWDLRIGRSKHILSNNLRPFKDKKQGKKKNLIRNLLKWIWPLWFKFCFFKLWSYLMSGLLNSFQ